jgi:hypothetical protein
MTDGLACPTSFGGQLQERLAARPSGSFCAVSECAHENLGSEGKKAGGSGLQARRLSFDIPSPFGAAPQRLLAIGASWREFRPAPIRLPAMVEPPRIIPTFASFA